MNAAFLLLTTAWMAGADPVEKVPGPGGSGAPVASACGCGSSSCGSCCDSCCDEGLLGRLRGRLRRGNDCGCDNGGGFLSRIRGRFRHDDCCQPSCCQPTCQPTCCQPVHTCCQPVHTCCQPTCGSSCGSCDCGRESLRDRLRGLFRRGNDCCDSGCGGCGGCGGAYTDKKPEVVPLPKGSGTGSDILQKLPNGDTIPTIPSKETPY